MNGRQARPVLYESVLTESMTSQTLTKGTEAYYIELLCGCDMYGNVINVMQCGVHKTEDDAELPNGIIEILYAGEIFACHQQLKAQSILINTQITRRPVNHHSLSALCSCSKIIIEIYHLSISINLHNTTHTFHMIVDLINPPTLYMYTPNSISITGNVFVIAAILLERNLQSVANYLILSLAVADLLVAGLVMPLSAVYLVSDEWRMGSELCDMWTSSDVLCCTASILHLVAIALDR